MPATVTPERESLLRRLARTVWRAFWGLLFGLLNAGTTRYWVPCLGRPHEAARMFLLRRLGATIGPGSFLRCQAMVTAPWNLRLGRNTIIGARAKLYLSNPLTVGDEVEIGPGLTVVTAEHHLPDPDLPLGKQGGYSAPVTIGSGVYIGANVTILRGVTLGERLVVGAGSLVNRDLESGFVYAGVPARKIRPLEQEGRATERNT